MSDTLTNGGLDDISSYPKTFSWGVPGDRQILLTTAGNLATSQAVVKTLSEQMKDKNNVSQSILNAPTMFQVARIVSQTLAEVIDVSSKWHQKAENKFSANFILGGQINNNEMALYLIYPEGNFIEVSHKKPFFQIGETKYGRPILVRAFETEMSFEDAIRLLMVSFDSTIKANLSVGLPLDLFVYINDSLTEAKTHKITEDNEYFRMVSREWADALKKSLAALPKFEFNN